VFFLSKGMMAASGIRADNSSRYPALNATGLLDWEGIPALSYRVPASRTVTAGVPGTLELTFTAAPPTVNGSYTSIVTVTVGTLEVGPMTVTFDVELPTAITLATFKAAPQDDAILVTWETAMELDHVGFNLYRSMMADGPYTQLNDTLIPPQFPGEVMGGTYEWLDTDVQPGVTYYYKLEDIDVKGVSTFHGPVSTAVVTGPTVVKLQRVSAQPAITPLVLGLTMGLGLAGVCFPKRSRSRSITKPSPGLHA